MTLNPKQVVKEWLSEQFNKRVKEPVAWKIKKLENQASQKWNEYSGKAKDTSYQPIDYYRKQESFYRGLFWSPLPFC